MRDPDPAPKPELALNREPASSGGYGMYGDCQRGLLRKRVAQSASTGESGCLPCADHGRATKRGGNA